MKTNVRTVSLDNHSINKKDGTYRRTTDIIKQYLAEHRGALPSDIERDTGLRANQISGRLHAMKKRGEVGEGETVETVAGHYATRLYLIVETKKYSVLSDGQSILLS